MKKIFLALLVALVLLAIFTMSAQALCTDTTNIGGDGSLAHQTGYVIQYPDNGSDEPIVDPTPDPVPDPIPNPDPEEDAPYTWRWNIQNDDAPEPGGKDK